MLLARQRISRTSNYAMQGKGETPLVCQRCLKGPSYHDGHERQDPNCLLHGCTSNKTKDIQEFIKQRQIEQAVRKALEGPREPPPDLHARGSTSPTAAASSTTRTSPPPPPAPPTEAKKHRRHRPPLRRRHVDSTAVTLKPVQPMKIRPKTTWTSTMPRKPSSWTPSRRSSLASKPEKGGKPLVPNNTLQFELLRAHLPP